MPDLVDKMLLAWRDRQSLVVRCSFCSDWSFEGTAVEARAAAAAHRATLHPDAISMTTRRRSKEGIPCVRECGRRGTISSGAYRGWCSTCRDGAVSR